VASASPVTIISPVACGIPVLYALPYPFRFSMIIFASLSCAICLVLSVESPSITIISSPQFFCLKYFLFIESIVAPIPFSSLIVGSITVIFVEYHLLKKKQYIKYVKKSL